MVRVIPVDKESVVNKMLTIFLTFTKIGLFTFGGGYAMISIIENICVEQKKWITHDEMMDVTVIAESTPGPIAINCATYVGYKQKGIWGAVAATLGVVLPSFIIIYLISSFLNHFLEITWIANAFQGIRIAVGLLILDAGINMFLKMKKKLLPCVIMGCSFVTTLLISLFAWNFSSVLLMLIAAVVSLVIFCIQGAPSKKGGEGR
ncbi:MAG: chromate transporter [Lachnospiraceae bacterium]|nr:chromate transporter [Lachnospiraceae bacterium]